MTRITIYDNEDGALPMAAGIYVEDEKVIVRNKYIKIEIPRDELLAVMTEELHG